VFCGYPVPIVFNPTLLNLIRIEWKYQITELVTNNQARMENMEIFPPILVAVRLAVVNAELGYRLSAAL
jgi:hypothetical protein